MSGIVNSHVDTTRSQAFWDTNRLQNLKADSSDPESLKAAAEEFSSLMFQMIIKSMRKAQAGLKSSLFSSETYQHYEEMHDQQLALHIAKTSNNAVVDTVVQQFSKNKANKEALAKTNNSKPIQQTHIPYHIQSARFASPAKNAGLEVGTTCAAQSSARTEQSKVSTTFNGRQDFIDKLLPSAVAAAQKIGLDPKLLLAQAALETGWGAKIAKLPNGDCSHNLFGIKASRDWMGEKVASKTTEFNGGVLQRKTDYFRAYEDFAASMHDYVHLIGDTQRYQHSKDTVNNPELYTKSLQDAGYATDPEYGKKILTIFRELQQ